MDQSSAIMADDAPQLMNMPVECPKQWDARAELGEVGAIVYMERRTDKPELDAIDEAIKLLREYKRRIWGVN